MHASDRNILMQWQIASLRLCAFHKKTICIIYIQRHPYNSKTASDPVTQSRVWIQNGYEINIGKKVGWWFSDSAHKRCMWYLHSPPFHSRNVCERSSVIHRRLVIRLYAFCCIWNCIAFQASTNHRVIVSRVLCIYFICIASIQEKTYTHQYTQINPDVRALELNVNWAIYLPVYMCRAIHFLFSYICICSCIAYERRK
jgi:hypothetical protein